VAKENYFGEYEAFRSDWNLFSFVRLKPVWVFGLIVSILQWQNQWRLSEGPIQFSKEAPFDWNPQESNLSVIFGLCFALFYLLNHEVWKRYQNRYAEKIGVDLTRGETNLDPWFQGMQHGQTEKDRTKCNVLWWTGLILQFLVFTAASIYCQILIGSYEGVRNRLGTGALLALVCYAFEITFYCAMNSYLPFGNLKFLAQKKRIMIVLSYLFKSFSVHIPIICVIYQQVRDCKEKLDEYTTCKAKCD
jgi:hypothetical protein